MGARGGSGVEADGSAWVPPVGLEPTLVTLLGGLPLPLGYEGPSIIPAIAKSLNSHRFGLSAHETVGPSHRDRPFCVRFAGQLTRRSSWPFSTCGRLASSNAWRGSLISGSDAKSRRRKKASVQSDRTRNFRLNVGTANRW